MKEMKIRENSYKVDLNITSKDDIFYPTNNADITEAIKHINCRG
jgi:hypothetical protein